MAPNVAAGPDWGAVAAQLAKTGRHLDLASHPSRLAGGLANRNFRVVLDGAPAVFRCPPVGKLAHGASDMAREAKVLGALHPHFPLAPALLHACLDSRVIGVPFLLLEWRPGVAIGAELPPAHAASAPLWMPEVIAGTMAALHQLEPGAIGLGDLGRQTGFAERHLRGWIRRAEAAFGDERPSALDALIVRLSETCPADAPVRLLHMDLKFDNLLLDLAGEHATALIDWDMATLGPPAFDMAVLLSYWIEPGDPEAVQTLQAVPSLQPGWPDREAMLACITSAAGAVPPDVPWYLALARLRLATAWMQLYRLWQRGALEGDRYDEFASLADAILTHARDRFGDI
ncbi:MAG: phosphotransferase family protein [Thermaurantiacus sp.]